DCRQRWVVSLPPGALVPEAGAYAGIRRSLCRFDSVKGKEARAGTYQVANEFDARQTLTPSDMVPPLPTASRFTIPIENGNVGSAVQFNQFYPQCLQTVSQLACFSSEALWIK